VRRSVRGGHGSVGQVKKLVFLLLFGALGVALARRLSAQHQAPNHAHGTPDHWPPVARKQPGDA